MYYTQYTHQNRDIFLIDMRASTGYPFSELVDKGLRKYIRQGKKVLLIASKKGYASGTICQDCGYIPRCEHCDIAIALHQDQQGSRFGLCHICKQQYSSTVMCQQCGGHDIQHYGVGTQQVAQLVEKEYNTSVALVDSLVANSPQKITRIFTEIDKAQVIVGTSLLAVPPRDINVDLVVVLSADVGLHVPDFQSNRHTFTGLYDICTHYTESTILIQSYNPEHRAIHHACALDIVTMQQEELAWRKQNAYPPSISICVLLYKHEIEERLYTSTNKLYQELLFLKETYGMSYLEIYTTPPLIYKMYDKYRYNIILKGSGLRQFMDIAYSKLHMRSRGFKIDWEPMHLL